MARLVLVLLVLAVIISFSLQGVKERVKKDLAQPVSLLGSPSKPTPFFKKQKKGTEKESIFVPYWAVPEETLVDEYDSYIYFGIALGNDGIALDEQGSQTVDTFLSVVPEGRKKFLTLRMINNNSNLAVLKNSALQKKLISQTVALAQEKGFDGIVLDLELSAIPFDSLVNQISAFTTTFYSETKKKETKFIVTLYGDVFYRFRPFDVKKIAQNADSVLIMAYDFHKARSNPGPNFPLHGKELYGYDLAQMSDEFLRVMPVQKVGVIFGLFGYDWLVDDKGNALAQAKPLTYNEIQQKFLQGCNLNDCVIKHDVASSETKITYTDSEGKKHIVWFEDMESVQTKQNYLQEKGINTFSYWAHSYF